MTYDEYKRRIDDIIGRMVRDTTTVMEEAMAAELDQVVLAQMFVRSLEVKTGQAAGGKS